MKPRLTIERLRDCAGAFAAEQGGRHVKSLHGVTDGKAVGTHIEHEFQEYLEARFSFRKSTSAAGIDFPDLLVDIKTTSIRQPQSSCPFKSARQKIYGLGYSLLVFAYEKKDDARRKAGVLTIRHVVFVAAEQTADFQTTKGILALLGAARKQRKRCAPGKGFVTPAGDRISFTLFKPGSLKTLLRTPSAIAGSWFGRMKRLGPSPALRVRKKSPNPKRRRGALVRTPETCRPVAGASGSDQCRRGYAHG